jgi:hypothetical protein
MRRNLALLAAALLLAGAAPARAQTVLVPSDAANYHRKLDLASQDQEILLLPQSTFALDHGPYRLRFESAALDSLVQAPPTVSYLSVHEPGLLFQVLHLRAHEPDTGMLGPQHFVVEDANGSVVGAGTLLVAGAAPEGLGLLTAEGDRSLELGREADVRLRVRPHGNLTGSITAGNERDFQLVSIQPEAMDSTGVLTLAARIRPLREGATELRLSAETVDGRSVPLVFPDLSVNAPAPRRVRIGGGPAYVDEAGRGTVMVTVLDLPANLTATPEVVGDAGGEMLVTDQRFDREHGTLTATLELTGRGSHPAAGGRDGREVRVRAGARTFRGSLEVVGPPVASTVRVEGAERPVLPIGGRAVLRIAGKNLERLHLDCSDLGKGSSCRTLGSASDELVAEVRAGSEIREGEQELVLRADPRADGSTPDRRVSIRVRAEYPAIPAPLAGADFLRVPCPTDHGCHVSGDGQSMVVRSSIAEKLLLHFDDPAIPAEYGWQKLIVTVTRARGDQRQVVRTYGSSVSPRMVRNGSRSGDLPLLDPTLDPKHGDLFIVRVEHAADQYAPEYRTGLASAEAYVRRIYIDGGPAKRLSGDIVVQPVLFALGADSTGGMKALYPNAGLGMTWQFLNGRLEPRPYSVKLQALLTNLQSTGSGGLPGQPALFLSGNLRIPGSDPSRPLVLTTGVARTFGEDGRWQLLVGAGIDLGVANMIFGG